MTFWEELGLSCGDTTVDGDDDGDGSATRSMALPPAKGCREILPLRSRSERAKPQSQVAPVAAKQDRSILPMTTCSSLGAFSPVHPGWDKTKSTTLFNLDAFYLTSRIFSNRPARQCEIAIWSPILNWIANVDFFAPQTERNTDDWDEFL